MIVASMKAILIVTLSPKTLVIDTKDLVANPKALISTTITPLLLERMPYIYYPLRFQKDQSNVEALIDPSSEVNIMILAYIKKLGL